MAKSPKLLSLISRQTVLTNSIVEVRLFDPCLDRPQRWFKLLCKIRWLTASAYHLDNLIPKFRRIWSTCSWHHPLPSGCGAGLWSCGKRGPCPFSHSLHRLYDDDSTLVSTKPGQSHRCRCRGRCRCRCRCRCELQLLRLRLARHFSGRPRFFLATARLRPSWENGIRPRGLP